MSNTVLGPITSVIKTDKEYLVQYKNNEIAKLNILNDHVFKYYMSPKGLFHEYPVPNNPEDTAKINIKKVSDYDRDSFVYSILDRTDQHYKVMTNSITIRLDKIDGTMSVIDTRTNKIVMSEATPLSYDDERVTQTLQQAQDEYFFGGGMQNGRFTHKGQIIHIVNTNNWVDGGVTSPNPFFWSTNGYGVLRNTWQPGVYNFGAQNPNIVEAIHTDHDDAFDAFFFINSKHVDILNDYYELTGQPIFMPEYAFYEAHLNAFNRDYWVKVDAGTPGAIVYEDGCYYKCYQPKDMDGKEGILESLNGEKNNYQFSARAMIDRYQRHDMPLGWFIPNDGYGCGYGQTDSLEGDIQNLREFAEYAKKNGVEAALWTESNLEPKDPEHPKKGDRDLGKEVSIAGVVALKCDVAWIGSGYSFGLSAVEKATNIFVREAKHKVRPMIVMVDGWAGTQRYSSVWSGDQTGGEWEYIRFHIPTYIGAGLSGLPIVGSDMDGIYGGNGKEMNVRDYQWKAFTPLQLNMDGWGKIQKTPFTFDDEAKNINRAYLKLKSMLMPYNYTISHETLKGMPMIRAMFLEFPNEDCAYTKDSQYQFMWGRHILVAPVYKEQYIHKTWVHNGIYLPDPNQVWIDMFTGEKYQGGKILNTFKTPLWKIPVFIKDGAIIPMTNPNNNPGEIKRDERIINIYPNGETTFRIYEDDGISDAYLENHYAKCNITVVGPKTNEKGDLTIHIGTTNGHYKEMVARRTTLLRIMASQNVEHIKATMNDKHIHVNRVETEKEFEAVDNAFYFKENYVLNPYMNEQFFEKEKLQQTFLLIKLEETDVSTTHIHLKIKDFANEGTVFGSNTCLIKSMKAPSGFTILDEDILPTTLTLRWNPIENVYYEIERDGVVFTNIIGSDFTFEDFTPETEHKFRIRSASLQGVSKWSYYIVVVTTKDPLKNAVQGVKVKCNIPCQPCQEVCLLTDGDPKSLWHTHWGKPDQADPQKGSMIKLNFDLGDVYEIDRIEYTPREDAGNGTILQIEHSYSVDGKKWSPLSERIHWEHDEAVKNIDLNGAEMRYVELRILDSIGGFGSGKHILFFTNVY